MKNRCGRCGDPVHTDEREQVEQSFDFDYTVCLECARIIWHENEVNQTMLGPPQDEGDSGQQPR